ncbi:MAG TPA: gamma-glutamyl-gamma-aminobutyrate hydrolase family protein [Candidatus Polarisedimenticolaceae bacterium]|nr:gamma-glutamyl-gamma-aminobutyrate hydrolase family protein [Candidatus Polarisedimenticolaceae bacterium]
MSINRPKRLWIIDPSMAVAETQGIAEVVGEWAGEHRVFQPALCPGDGPRPGDGYDTDGVVLLGSRASVFDRLGWLTELGDWIAPIVAGRVRLPLLGICFGHQLIAHVAGARVAPLSDDGAKRVGVETSILEGSRLVPGRVEIPVVVSHREIVRACPERFQVVARRQSVPIDGIEHDELPVFAFQFHPEARDEFAVRVGIEPRRIDDRLRVANRRLLAAFRDRV